MSARALQLSVLLACVLVSAGIVPARAQGAARVLDRITAERAAADPRFDRLERWSARGRPTLAMALSGGGGYGVAHVGVLGALLDDGVEIDAIAGTSIGAMIGAFVSAGYEPHEVEEILRGKNWDALTSGLDVRRRVLSKREELYRSAQLSFSFRRGRRVQAGALAEASLLKRELYRYLLRAQLESGGDFDRLLYRYRAVATDIRTGRELVADAGDLVAAVLGSSAVPGLFRPVPFGDAVLVDGGLVQNIPVEAARTLGTDLVMAVDVSQRAGPAGELRGTLDLLNRSINIMTERRSRELLEQADLVLSPDVKEFKRGRLGTNVDGVVRTGREAYERQRDEIWSRLERAASDRAPVLFDRVEVTGTDWIRAGDLVERLGGAPGSVTRYRVSAEVARALNRGPFSSGRAELVADGEGRVLRFLFEENARIEVIECHSVAVPNLRSLWHGVGETGQRFSPAVARRIHWNARAQLIDEGRVLVRLDEMRWQPETGTVTVQLSNMGVDRIETEVEGEIPLRRTERFLRGLEGEDFRFDDLASRLDEMVARGAVFDWTLTPRRGEAGELDLVVRFRGDDYFEVAAGGSFRSEHGFGGFLRGAKSNFTGRGDFVDLLATAAKDRTTAQLRYRTEYGFGFQNLGVDAGVLYFNNNFLVVDDDQDLVDELDEEYSGERFWGSLIRRLRWGAVVQTGLSHETDRLEATPTEPKVRLDRTSAFLNLDLDRHDRLLFPERGGGLELRAESSFSGDSLWKAELEADVIFGLGPERRHVLTSRYGAGLSDDADRRPFWFDPGGYRGLYGFIPYGAAAPQYATTGLIWRYRWLDLNLARLYVEAGADWITTALDRGDLGDDGTLGYGASIVAHSRFLGPIAVGIAQNDEGATTLFVTVGFPFLGE